MLAEVALESFRFFDRTTLEVLQMHSRYLRDLVNRHSRSLPLRYINNVHTADGRVYIQLLEEDRDAKMIVGQDQQYMEMIFHYVNNAFVRRLTLSFDRAHLAAPYFLRANANELQCQIRALRVESTRAAVDYALVDFLGVHLKPQAYEVSKMGELREEHVMLFKQNALRDNVKHLLPTDAASVPDCILPELFGQDVVESCAIITRNDPRPWIGRFIKMFETLHRGTDTVRSVTLIHIRRDKTPLRLAVEPLGQPRRSNIPTPHSAFLKAWLPEWILCLDGIGLHGITAIESTLSKLFVFENATSAKRLEVHVWSIDVRRNNTPFGLSYAFLLQVVDM